MNRRIYGLPSTGSEVGPLPRRMRRPKTWSTDWSSADGSISAKRLLVSSLPDCRLTKEHWLLVVRRRWGVETTHQILDTAFAEDISDVFFALVTTTREHLTPMGRFPAPLLR